MFRLPHAVVIHSKSLKNIANQLRCVTVSNTRVTRNNSSKSSDVTINLKDDVGQNKFESFPSTPDREVCLFGPKDIRAPLPGNIGIVINLINTNISKKIIEFDPSQLSNAEDTINAIASESNYARQYRVMEQVINPEYEESVLSQSSQTLESVAHECPALLIKDFRDLFPLSSHMKPELNNKLTVVTLCQKTDNDMSAWTSEVDAEREELMDHFVIVAKDICNYLTDSGFWADFIDPSSGRPYLGEYTNATFFETDDRYRNFGFTIEDLGCCKVISHHVWGTHSFVGAIFTNAPMDSIEMEKVLNNSYTK